MKECKLGAVSFQVRGTFEGYSRMLIWVRQCKIGRETLQRVEGRVKLNGDQRTGEMR